MAEFDLVCLSSQSQKFRVHISYWLPFWEIRKLVVHAIVTWIDGGSPTFGFYSTINQSHVYIYDGDCRNRVVRYAFFGPIISSRYPGGFGRQETASFLPRGSMVLLYFQRDSCLTRKLSPRYILIIIGSFVVVFSEVPPKGAQIF